MNDTAVESTTLATIAYDEAGEVLQLEFRGRMIYQYFGVPATVHEALLCAPSKGSYCNQAIRGKFLYRRISNGEAELPEQDIATARRW